MYCPFSKSVGSRVPSVAFVTGATPEANVVKVVGLPLPSNKEYSSFQEPVVTDPTIGVGAVISWPSVSPETLPTGGGGGGAIPGFTVTVVTEVACNKESLASNWITYTPAAPNVACVTSELGLLNVTVAGPLTTLQATDNVLPAGSPSSLASPRRATV